MTRDKDFKNLVRRTAAETGRSYVAARAQLTQKPPPASSAADREPASDLVQQARNILNGPRGTRRRPEAVEDAQAVLRPALERRPLQADAVHLAIELLMYQKDDQQRVELARSYLAQPLEPTEEAWARFHVVDGLAVQAVVADRTVGSGATPQLQGEVPRWASECVSEHRELLSWARVHLQPEQLAAQWYDSTIAHAWKLAGEIDAWIREAVALVDEVPKSPANRHDRFFLLETLQQFADAANADRARAAERDLLGEDPAWEDAFYMTGRLREMELEAFRRSGDLQAAHTARDQTASWLESELAAGRPAETVAALFHDLGCDSYWAGEHRDAARLLARAVELDNSYGFTWLLLAACRQVLGSRRPEILDLLRDARARMSPDETRQQFLTAPEFADVRDDPDFREVLFGERRG